MKLYSRTTIILSFLVLMFVMSCEIFNPPPNAYSNKILFTSERSGKNQLYMMDPDGREITQITSGEYGHSFGRWSPNADRIVCNTGEGYTTIGMRMVIFESDGSNRKILNQATHMSWSPDGTTIAFIYNPSIELGATSEYIYTISSDGTDLKKITNLTGENISRPCWSLDGSKIYFSSNRNNIDDLKSLDIYCIDCDGDNIKRITNTPNGKTYSVCVSPSGNEITFMSKQADSLWASIYISNIDGSNIKLITSPTKGMVYNWPSWSPDGSQIIFYAGTSFPARHYLYLISIDGSNLQQVVSDSSITSSDWSK